VPVEVEVDPHTANKVCSCSTRKWTGQNECLSF